MGGDVVVPFAVPVVRFEGDGGEFFLGDPDPGGVRRLVPLGGDLQAGRGGGRRDQLDDGPVRDERPAPVRSGTRSSTASSASSR
jgi:hypothetical protein